jgi:hypothetical protein
MKRFTFVVQVHPDGIKTLENLGTHERVPVSELAEIGPRIERWLATVGYVDAQARGENTRDAGRDRPGEPR